MKKSNLVIIKCNNEPIYSYNSLKDKYNIIPYNANLWFPELDYKYANSINDILNIKKGNRRLSKKITSLIYNWHSMLEKYIDLPDDTIFGESDIHAYSSFDYADIRNDTYDVYRLYFTIDTSKECVNKPKNIYLLNAYDLFQNWRQYSLNWNKIHCGTHALIIPKNKREKIIQVYKNYKEPTDIALVKAVQDKYIKMGVLNYNAFTQYPH